MLSGLSLFKQISQFAWDGRLQLGHSTLVTQAGLAVQISVLQPCWGGRCLPRQKQLLESAKAMAGIRGNTAARLMSLLCTPGLLKFALDLGNFSCVFSNAPLWLRDTCAGGNWVDLKPGACLFEMLRKEFFPETKQIVLGSDPQLLQSDRHPVTSAEDGM